MPDVKQFDPGLTNAIWNGINITGFADDMIEAENDEDQYTDDAGPGGDVVIVKNRDKRGDVTFVLQAESETNDLLSAAASLPLVNGAGLGPLHITNLNSRTVIKASRAWIKKKPAVGINGDPGTRTWVIRCADLEIFAGGAVI